MEAFNAHDTTFKIAISNMELHKKLLPGDPAWSKFNASFENMDMTIPDLTNAVYFGRAITTHHSNHWRVTQNYLCGQHIGLDFDAGDESSSLKLLEKDSFIARYAAFAHTTMSHKPEFPRARVLFVLDVRLCRRKITPWLRLRFCGYSERPIANARMRYVFSTVRLDAIFHTLPMFCPWMLVKHLIMQYLETGASEKRRTVRSDYRPPASQQDVADALKVIDPWGIDYDEWVSVLMAIHSQFGEAGFSLAEHWADGSRTRWPKMEKAFTSLETGPSAGR